MQHSSKYQDPFHELWLIYCLLKDAETDPESRLQLVSSARAHLGQVVNALNRSRFEQTPHSPDALDRRI